MAKKKVDTPDGEKEIEVTEIVAGDSDIEDTKVNPDTTIARPRVDSTVKEESPDGLEDAVVFKLNYPNTQHRVFSLEEHGEDYEDLADRFEKSHKAKILSRKDF